MANTSYPLRYQINTHIWLNELSRQLGRPVTLDDIADTELDHLTKLGIDWVWLLSLWRTGEASRAVSRSRADWRREFEETLPDLREDDIAGSGFAITGYKVAENLPTAGLGGLSAGHNPHGPRRSRKARRASRRSAMSPSWSQ
jgi:hypothetical protein